MENIGLTDSECLALMIYLTEADCLQVQRCFENGNFIVTGVFDYNSVQEDSKSGLVRLVRFSCANKGSEFLPFEGAVSDEQIVSAIENITAYNRKFMNLFEPAKINETNRNTQLYLNKAYKLKDEKENLKSQPEKDILDLASELYAIKFLFNDRLPLTRIIQNQREKTENQAKKTQNV